MKRFGNLYEKICGFENIRLAHKKAQRGKRHYDEVKMVNLNEEYYLKKIQEILKNKAFVNSPYKIFKKRDKGKEREIYKLPYFPDRIVQHCIMNVLEPIWEKLLIKDTYSAIKKRGIHSGAKRLKSFLKDEEGTKYCLKLDVKKFYPSIDHDVLKRIIRKKIKCNDTLQIIYTVINSASGVPIGNYLSQYFGNLYLTYFDHWVKEVIGIKYYMRYCDDIVILHSDKSYLHFLFRKIQNYLKENLKLTIKQNWQIFPSRIRGIDFLGYRFFGKYTLVRKRVASSFKRKIKRIKTNHNVMQQAAIINSVMSYYGWLKHCNGYNLWKSQIDDDIKTIFNDICQNKQIKNPLGVVK